MNNAQPIVLQSTEGSSNSQCISGCMYRIVQTTSLDGKNLLKLIPISNKSVHYIPAVSLPISTSSTSTKANMISVATTDCSAHTTCFPVLQHTNTGSFLITSVEAPVSNSNKPPANSSQEKILAAPAVAPLQCPSVTAVTLSGLPIQRTPAAATSATGKGSRIIETATLQSPTAQKTQPSSTLPVKQRIYKVSLPSLPLQKTQLSLTMAPNQMTNKVTAVTLHGPAVQKTHASPTLSKDVQTDKLTTVTFPGTAVTFPGALVRSTPASPTSTADEKTYMLLKSPVLPSGHHLQIPANAEVKSVPATLLPLAIQQKILSTTASNLANLSQSAKPPPTVIYVSPVNTVKTMPKRQPNIHPKNIVEVPTVLIASNSSVPSSASAANSAGVSNIEQSKFWDAPVKSALENKQQMPHCLIPIKSSSNLASKILKNLADQQQAKGRMINLMPPPHTETEVDFFSPLKDNALVMYNSKVYLVIQKNSGSSSPGAERVSTSEGHTEKENTSSIVLPQTNLQIKIKEEPEDPDFEPVKQENQLESWRTDRCDAQNPSKTYRAQGLPCKYEHMESVCGMVGKEADEQLLKKAGIHTDLRICLTRISPKLLEQWEKSNSPAGRESPTHQTKKVDGFPTDGSSKQTLMLPIDIKKEPIETEYYAYHTKEMEIKLEPKSPVKRKTESINCSMAVKKQCLKRFISNWESEHAYSCLPVYSTVTPTLSTNETSHINCNGEQTVLGNTTGASSVPRECSVMESSPSVTISTGTDNAHGLHSASSIIPAPSISSPSTGHSSATETNTAHTYTPLLPLSVDETTRDEKIRRLKEILKEKEAALEAIRKKMIKAKSSAKTKRKSDMKHSGKRPSLNRESEHAYSCQPGETSDGTACISPGCGEKAISGSLKPRSVSNVESSRAAARSAVANKVFANSAISHEHVPTILPPPSVDKITRDEKIRRLKEILKQKEAALETIRMNKVSAHLQS